MAITKMMKSSVLLDEWDLPFGGTDEIIIVSNEMRHSNRWSNTFELVIHDLHNDIYWSMLYDIGTGDEGERPWEYEKEVELTKVVPKIVEKIIYVNAEG